MKNSAYVMMALAVSSVWLTGCELTASAAKPTTESHHEGEGHEGGHAAHKIIVTSPIRRDVVNTQPYVCQIHSCKHIDVLALEGGYLQEIRVKEGQLVKKGDLLFQIQPILYQARLDSEKAEADRIRIELDNAQVLNGKGIVSPQEIAIKKAELAKALAKVSLAQAELSFTSLTAPFDGIVDRQRMQPGSLIESGDVLTTLSDNSVVWAYFNVPERRYLQYMADMNSGNTNEQMKIELKLANGQIFPESGKIGAIEADFNNTTGNIAFRADFANPDRLLRHGQTGTILLHTTLKDVLVIPQRATFEILDKRYAYVVGEDNVVHQRLIAIGTVLDDVFVVTEGLQENDKLILEGIRQVRDGSKIEYEFADPHEVLKNLKYHAE